MLSPNLRVIFVGRLNHYFKVTQVTFAGTFAGTFDLYRRNPATSKAK
jgi:hypothetical protein